MRNQNYFDLLALFRTSPFGEDPEQCLPDPGVVSQFMSTLVAYISKAKTSLKIASGEANFHLYSDPQFLQVLRFLAQRGVRIALVLGPVVSRGLTQNSPEMFQLTQDGSLEIYYRAQRGGTAEVFLCDDREAWLCDRWSPDFCFQTPPVIRHLSVKNTRDMLQFNAVLRTFKHFMAFQNRVIDPWSDFLVLRPSEIRALRASLDVPEMYESLQLQDLVSLLRDARRLELERKPQGWAVSMNVHAFDASSAM